MLKQKLKNRFIYSRKIVGVAMVSLVLAGTSIYYTGFVRADQYDEQIRALQQQNDVNQQAADDLASRASSYQDAVNRLAEQIDALQQAIVENQSKSDELQKQIELKKIELKHQEHILGEDIKALYLEGEITTLEILASSKDISEFVNREADRTAVQNKIKATVDQIKELKLRLEQQQRELQQRITDLQNQRSQQAAAQAQQAELLAYTEGQKATYDQQIRSNNSRISELRRQQIIENARAFGGGAIIRTDRCDIYPQNWCNAPMDSIVDSWGMYNRECVSWTAYRVAVSGRYMPYWGGRGNANEWDDNAIAAGIPVDRNPRVGDVGISNAGYYGHSVYVEDVYDDGAILISQFNVNWQGTYSLARIPVGNLVFIHFP